MRRPIIDPNKNYTFRDYFEMNVPINELLAYFGYTHQMASCTLARSTTDLTPFAHLKGQLENHLQYAYLTSETARREVLVAPVILSVAIFLKTPLQIEYPLNVTKQLKGKVDYYLQRNGNLLIIEAKHDDMTRGFTQLAVEMIAFDQWLEADDKPLYGIVTIGDAWRFGYLDRVNKQICQDTRLYAIPTEIEELLRILIAIFEN